MNVKSKQYIQQQIIEIRQATDENIGLHRRIQYVQNCQCNLCVYSHKRGTLDRKLFTYVTTHRKFCFCEKNKNNHFITMFLFLSKLCPS